MDNSKTYCVMPHIGMSIQNHGDICVCNINNLSFKKPNKEVFFIHKDGLKGSWDSTTRTHIVELLDSGQGHHPSEHNFGCQRCYDVEKANQTSQRITLNRIFKNVEAMPTQPRVMIIKPGNVCNLSCRMCNPATSSNWYTDGYKLAVKYDGVTESFATWAKNFEHIRNGFNADNEKFWDDFDEWLPNFVFVDIYGGEPFLSNRLFQSLGQVAESGAASNISLQLHTNATIYNENYLDILSKFKSVKLKLSIDSHVPEHNEYIRYPVNGASLLENIAKFKNYVSASHNNIQLGLSLTIDMLNIYNYSEIRSGLINKFRIPVHDNIVTDPSEYDMRILPTEVKQEILNKNAKCRFINSLRHFLLQEVPDSDKHFKKFWQITKDLDQFRGQSFEETFPEYYESLKPYIE